MVKLLDAKNPIEEEINLENEDKKLQIFQYCAHKLNPYIQSKYLILINL